ncbi:ABC transporter ATP-binding protein [Rhodoligotrophos defluvii]|uniref:ABC transporter ATP-binding protein n=1 Tax=Rhodoligotrophos defluvii TaxID=2561934 RepID=UPI00195F37F9|nr:ABC transporter ATP-binding protein [Rhodoligotrophos defluvii]
MNAFLSLERLTKRFGGLTANEDVSFDLRPGVITALVGPNGAGKTTLFNLITGNLRMDAGRVLYRGRDISGWRPHRIARLGIARSFQDLRLFDHMSVGDNVRTATEPDVWFWQRGSGAERNRRVEQAMQQTGLVPYADKLAVELGYAARKFLSMARIIASGSDIWLLDEPASGLDPSSRDQFKTLLRDAARRGVAVCLIEHNLDIVIDLADRIVFLHQGRVLAEGEPNEILKNPDLTAIYFGDAR